MHHCLMEYKHNESHVYRVTTNVCTLKRNIKRNMGTQIGPNKCNKDYCMGDYPSHYKFNGPYDLSSISDVRRLRRQAQLSALLE